jgi:hypothetical protein
MTVSRSQPSNESLLSLQDQSVLDAVLIAHLKARIAELESELAGCRACREKIDCLSRGER